MRTVAFILVIALMLGSPFLASASEESEKNIAYLSYDYDAQRGLLTVCLNYCGEGISALGAVLQYDSELLDYTSYTYTENFKNFDVCATLDNCGEIRILAYSGERVGVGEIIRLYFKIKENISAHEVYFSLSCLSKISAATLKDGEVNPLEIGFAGVLCKIEEIVPPMLYGGKDPSGGILLVPATEILEECIFDITVVELSGKIRRKALSVMPNESGFSLDVRELGKAYTAVIVEPFYIENEKRVSVERGIYLFYGGEYIG